MVWQAWFGSVYYGVARLERHGIFWQAWSGVMVFGMVIRVSLVRQLW